MNIIRGSCGSHYSSLTTRIIETTFGLYLLNTVKKRSKIDKNNLHITLVGPFALPNAHFAINKKAVRHESKLRLLALKQHGWNLQMKW